MLAELMKSWADWAIQTGGLFGAGTMMALESMITPIPSEIVMPPLGMAVHQGKFEIWEAIAATSAGSLIGSLVGYYMGYFGGKPLVMKVGKYLMLNESHLDLTHRWFERWGGITVFVSRFIPVVRHVISIPAGTAKMNLLKFSLYTLVGATLWNSFLLWVGWKLESNWETLLKYRKPLDAAIIVILVLTVVAWFALHLRKPKTVTAANEPVTVGRDS